MSASDPARPLIGICAARERAAWSFWNQDAALVAGTYLSAVRQGGGLPVGLAPEALGAADVESLVGRLDGLLLIGGADLDPECYGQERSARTEATYRERDEFELALVHAAFAADLPVLGICRGLQVLNVASGGDLHQHLGDRGFEEHRRAPGSLGEETHHEIEIEPGSLLARVTGTARETVNSHHHQGVDAIGEGGRVVARSLPDGVVEAIEWPHLRHALGVQWHPEALELDRTVAALVSAASGDEPIGDIPLEAAT